MEKVKLKELANSLYFDMNDSQLEQLLSEFSQIYNETELFKNIDTTNVVETNFSLNNSCSVLRDDEPISSECTRKHLKNSKNLKDDYVVIK